VETLHEREEVLPAAVAEVLGDEVKIPEAIDAERQRLGRIVVDLESLRSAECVVAMLGCYYLLVDAAGLVAETAVADTVVVNDVRDLDQGPSVVLHHVCDMVHDEGVLVDDAGLEGDRGGWVEEELSREEEAGHEVGGRLGEESSLEILRSNHRLLTAVPLLREHEGIFLRAILEPVAHAGNDTDIRIRFEAFSKVLEGVRGESVVAVHESDERTRRGCKGGVARSAHAGVVLADDKDAGVLLCVFPANLR